MSKDAEASGSHSFLCNSHDAETRGRKENPH